MFNRLFNSIGQRERKILALPIIIILLLSITLTLSPAIRFRSWAVSLRWVHWIGFIVWITAYCFIASIIIKKRLNTDFIIYASIQLITGIGLIIIWRLNTFFGFRQSLWLLFCSALSGVLIKNEQILETFKKFKYLLFISGLGLIVLTFFFGTYPGGNGPNLWLELRGIFFQPSELLKIILIIYLAAYFSDKPIIRSNYLQFVLPTALLACASIALLVFQRDFGTALIFISIYVLILFSVYGKRRILLFSFCLLLIITVTGYFAIDLIRIRFNAWVFPWGDPQAGSYQIIQSIIAIAAGGLLGTGVGLGYPNLVPLSHSDFVFSAISEELGLTGALGFLLLMAVILFKGISISLKAKNRFHRFLAIGIISYLITQSILIIGGNIRMLPITGVTLPFVSYGGSSLLVSYLGFAILLIIDVNQIPGTPKDRNQYKTVAGFFTICIFAIALTLGWWSIIHANDLQLRVDNTRNIIANLYVKRGEILDRNNVILAQSIGQPGEIQRQYTYPPLSNTIGFSHQKFGLSGIESRYGPYLRGHKGYPSQDIWLSYLLYDQPPEGRSVRLTIDAVLQQKSDQLLHGLTGGMVLLDANSGEILSISTSPFFNANELDEHLQEWRDDPSSPLLNRVTQSAYPVGGLLTPMLLTYEETTDHLQVLQYLNNSYDRFDPNCANNAAAINETLNKGCISSALNLAGDTSPSSFLISPPLSLLLTQPDIGLSTNPGIKVNIDQDWLDLFFGKEMLRSNPLQIASLFMPLSNRGLYISPSIVSAINTSTAGWVFISDPTLTQVFSIDIADKISSMLDQGEEDFWEISAITRDRNNTYAWYVGGTLNSQNKNKNYLLTLALEGESRDKVIEVGRQLLQYLEDN
jgi:cell division protein FtsW (lipid II flippase)